MHNKGENMEKTSKGRGSPARRYPDLYYRHVYLERDLYNMVHLFGHWNNVSDKKAAHILITYGLQYYAVAILRAEKARQSGQKPQKHEPLYSFEAISNFISQIKKRDKAFPSIPGQDIENPMQDRG
jgi:hypothetical protein